MRKIALSLASALVMGSMTLGAGADPLSPGAAYLHSLMQQNAAPISRIGCGGGWGMCPPGRTRVCGHWHCWCRPC
jgi:hypothetical protein